MKGLLEDSAMTALFAIQSEIDVNAVQVTAIYDYDCTCDGACNPQ